IYGDLCIPEITVCKSTQAFVVLFRKDPFPYDIGRVRTGNDLFSTEMYPVGGVTVGNNLSADFQLIIAVEYYPHAGFDRECVAWEYNNIVCDMVRTVSQ